MSNETLLASNRKDFRIQHYLTKKQWSEWHKQSLCSKEFMKTLMKIFIMIKLNLNKLRLTLMKTKTSLKVIKSIWIYQKVQSRINFGKYPPRICQMKNWKLEYKKLLINLWCKLLEVRRTFIGFKQWSQKMKIKLLSLLKWRWL